MTPLPERAKRWLNLDQSEEVFVAHCASELEALIEHEREGADNIAVFMCQRSVSGNFANVRFGSSGFLSVELSATSGMSH